MTELVQAYKKYKKVKNTGCGEFEAFQNFVRLVYPSQVAETIEYYEAEIDRLRQTLEGQEGLGFLAGAELSGSAFSSEGLIKVKLLPASDFDLECQMSLVDFLVSAECKAITPDDGCGNYGTRSCISGVSCWEPAPEWATHVYWYNK